MEPKKQSALKYIIYLLFLPITLFLSLHLAYCSEYVKWLIQEGRIEKADRLATVFLMLKSRLQTSPLAIVWTPVSERYLLYGSVLWFIVAAAIETSQKNYIHGKEFGTARWGRLSDIKPYFAETIARREIAEARSLKTASGRRRAKAGIKAEAEKNGSILESNLLHSLETDMEKKNAEGSPYSKKQIHQMKADIHKEVRERIKDEIRSEWKPDQYRAEYQLKMKQLNEKLKLGEINRKDWKQAEAATRQDKRKKEKQFFDPSEKIKKIREKYKDMDMLFTETERISFINRGINMNTLIMGGSGSGKTRGYAMPNILQGSTSYVITDPKGEILEKAGYYLEHVKGYRIRVLNLDDKSASDCYNPFVYLHPERPGYEERVLTLVETIILNTDGGEKKTGSDPFWDKAERLFEQAIFFAVSKAYRPGERNMNTVLKMIQMLEIKEDRDKRNSDLDIFFEQIYKPRFGEDDIAYTTFKEFRSKAAGKTAKSIVISAVARLQPFRTQEVRRIFQTDNMLLDEVGEKKIAVFVVTPPTDKTFNFIAGMLFTQLFQELQYCASIKHRHDGQHLPMPVRFIMDEFANVAVIPNFVSILSYARSFGIGITIIIQSLEQIKTMYKDEWGTIIDNCNSILFLGKITHGDTLKYISEIIGKGTFDKKTTGHTKGRSGSSSANFDVVGRELMTEDEIRRMPYQKCLLIVAGLPAFYSEKYHYESHPNYRFTSDANHSLSYEYTPMTPEQIEAKRKEIKELPYGEQSGADPGCGNNLKTDEPEPVYVDLGKQAEVLHQNIENIRFVDDSFFTVNNGEEQQVESELNRAFIESIMAEGEKTIERIGRNEDIRLIQKTAETAQQMMEYGGDYRFVPDDDLVIHNGEESAAEKKLNTQFIQYFSDDEPNEESEIRRDQEGVEDLYDGLKALADSLPDADGFADPVSQ